MSQGGTLKIPADLFEGMIEHCHRGVPNEACGFLGGRDGVVERLYRLTNAAASPVFYRPDDKEMIAAINDIDEAGLDLLGIFHSHVATRPYPSPTDVSQARYPDAVYVIVGLADSENPETRGYLIRKSDWGADDGEIEEVELVVS
jgi:[CysO sulfur-carrier protein]-S-L-cysteine hydrolase